MTTPRRVADMTSRDNLPAVGAPPLPFRLGPKQQVHIPRQAMFGVDRDLDVEVIWFRPTSAYRMDWLRCRTLGWLRCRDLITGDLYSLWVRTPLITLIRVPDLEHRQAC
jgi:hypothetical protein